MYKASPILFLSYLLLFVSCEQQKVIDLSEFILGDSLLQIELVAGEPDVILPVAMAQDDRGRLWVVEMPGYMRDIEGNGEDIADGRIVILEDTKGDGRMDKRTVFLDSLLNPRAIALVYDGLLFTDDTSLKWTRIQNDVAGPIEVVDSLYVIGGNIEHQPNGLLYNLDNWIYSAKSNVRYRKKDGAWLKEPTSFRGQWGLTMDRNGKLIYNNNSVPLAGDYAAPNRLIQNPYLRIQKSIAQLHTENMRIYPVQATAVNRGYQDGVLDTAGMVINYTSACGPLLYYGQALPEDYYGDAFVCAPEANLIVQYNVDESSFGPKAERVSTEKEFLVSTDESFRPVNLYTGFDGSLYIIDMRKGIIQHRAYMTNYLREKILNRGLDQINGLGRIYKVTSRQARTADSSPELSALEAAEVIELLLHPNLSLRMWAQQRLINMNDRNIRPALLKLIGNYRAPIGQVHALWTLEGMGLLTQADVSAIANAGVDESVLQQILWLSSDIADSDQDFAPFYEKVLALNNKKMDYILANLSSKNPAAMWNTLANRYPDDPYLAEALLSGGSGQEEQLLNRLSGALRSGPLAQVLQQTIQNRQENKIKAPQLLTEAYLDDRTNGLKLFKDYCTACHGIDGEGIQNLAPSLVDSEILENQDLRVADIILHGYNSETISYRLQMPAYGLDPHMTDQDIWDIISYLKSTFTGNWNSLKVEQVDSLRKVGVVN